MDLLDRAHRLACGCVSDIMGLEHCERPPINCDVLCRHQHHKDEKQVGDIDDVGGLQEHIPLQRRASVHTCYVLSCGKISRREGPR